MVVRMIVLYIVIFCFLCSAQADNDDVIGRQPVFHINEPPDGSIRGYAEGSNSYSDRFIVYDKNLKQIYWVDRDNVLNSFNVDGNNISWKINLESGLGDKLEMAIQLEVVGDVVIFYWYRECDSNKRMVTASAFSTSNGQFRWTASLLDIPGTQIVGRIAVEGYNSYIEHYFGSIYNRLVVVEHNTGNVFKSIILPMVQNERRVESRYMIYNTSNVKERIIAHMIDRETYTLVDQVVQDSLCCPHYGPQGCLDLNVYVEPKRNESRSTIPGHGWKNIEIDTNYDLALCRGAIQKTIDSTSNMTVTIRDTSLNTHEASIWILGLDTAVSHIRWKHVLPIGHHQFASNFSRTQYFHDQKIIVPLVDDVQVTELIEINTGDGRILSRIEVGAGIVYYLELSETWKVLIRCDGSLILWNIKDRRPPQVIPVETQVHDLFDLVNSCEYCSRAFASGISKIGKPAKELLFPAVQDQLEMRNISRIRSSVYIEPYLKLTDTSDAPHLWMLFDKALERYKNDTEGLVSEMMIKPFAHNVLLRLIELGDIDAIIKVKKGLVDKSYDNPNAILVALAASGTPLAIDVYDHIFSMLKHNKRRSILVSEFYDKLTTNKKLPSKDSSAIYHAIEFLLNDRDIAARDDMEANRIPVKRLTIENDVCQIVSGYKETMGLQCTSEGSISVGYLNKNRTDAVIAISYYVSSLNAGGYLFRLTQRDNKWYVIEMIRRWIS